MLTGIIASCMSSFWLVVIGVFAYEMRRSIQSAASEKELLVGVAHRVHTPGRHPREIARWTKVALAPLDHGWLWLEVPVEEAREMLGKWWDVHEPSQWASRVAALLGQQGPLRAWNGLRTIRVIMAGARLGWVSEAIAWELTTAIACELCSAYGGFDALWRDYHAGYRAWQKLPPGVSDGELAAREARIGQLAASSWLGVSFETPPFEIDAFAVDRDSTIALVGACVEGSLRG